MLRERSGPSSWVRKSVLKVRFVMTRQGSDLDREARAQTRVVAAKGCSLASLGSAATASSGLSVGEIALDEARAVAR